MGERPDDPLKAQTPRDVRVREHVLVVIIFDELVAKGLAEDQPSDCSQENTNAEDHPTLVGSKESAALSRGCPS